MLSYRRETALQGALQFSPKVEDCSWETIFYGHYRSIFNHFNHFDHYLVPFRSYRSLLFKFCTNAVTLTQNFR